jgi:CRP/FNR family transcriptional regulator, cyclic AMP receptor protein
MVNSPWPNVYRILLRVSRTYFRKEWLSRKFTSHPNLKPNEFIALSKDLSPIRVSNKNLTSNIILDITYNHTDQQYRLVLTSRDEKFSDELIDPTDRKKKAVTGFIWMGSVGIHLNPDGILLTLDQEENYKGGVRTSQPPAIINSGTMSTAAIKKDQQRFSKYDLSLCTDESPILLAPNSGELNMAIKPLSQGEKGWGLYLSNLKGHIRKDSPAVAVLLPDTCTLVDNMLFTKRATAKEGGLDARNWNSAISDPVLMLLKVDGSGQLTIEEMFTSGGIAIIHEPGKPRFLGSASDAQKIHCSKMIEKALSSFIGDGANIVQDNILQNDREKIIANAAVAIKKCNQDGVSKLALELAVKEILAPFYMEAIDTDSPFVPHEIISLLNSISADIIAWTGVDTSRALTVSAVEKAIVQGADIYPWDGIAEIMSLALPRLETNPSSSGSHLHSSLVTHAKKSLTAKVFVHEIRQIANTLKASKDKAIQQQIIATFDKMVLKIVTDAVEKCLVRTAVQGYLLQTEKECRTNHKFGLELSAIKTPGNAEIESIIKRYGEYAHFIQQAFMVTLARHIDLLIENFQHGTNDKIEYNVPTKEFLNYLVVLRYSGGKVVAASAATLPAISILKNIRNVIPDILIKQPDQAVSSAVLSMTHIEGLLFNASFKLSVRPTHIPDEIPNSLWYAFQDFAKFFIDSCLTGESKSSRDKKQVDAIAVAFTESFLLKVLNLYRDFAKESTSDGWENIINVLGKSNGALQVCQVENTNVEILGFKNHTTSLSQEPINLEEDLRQILVEQENAENVEMGVFRFKKHIHFDAMDGTSSVMFPVKILCKSGVLLLQAQHNDVVFERSVLLLQDSDGETEDPFSLDNKQNEIKKLSKKGINKLLNASTFFDQFSTYEKQKISEFTNNFKIYRKDDVILDEGSTELAMFVIIKGHVRALKKGHILNKYAPGEIFGEEAFLADCPQIMKVQSLTNVLVLRIDDEIFDRLWPESREKFKNNIIATQVATLSTVTRMMPKHKLPKVPPPDHSNLDGELAQMDGETAFKLIDQVSFFDRFSTFEKRRMISFFASFRTYQPNSEIIRENHTDKAFFILVRGEVQVIKGNSVIVEFSPGEFFGDMAFLTNKPRTTSVRSKCEVLVLRLNVMTISRLGSTIREKIKDQFMGKLTERVCQTKELVGQ